MGRLRKPDPNIMTKEDYDLYSRMYEEKKSKQDIKDALDESNRKTAEKEKQMNIEYKRKQAEEAEIKALENQKLYHRTTDPIITGEAVTTYKLPDGTTTTVKPSQLTGWKSVVETIKAAVNPFDENKVVATMGGKTFRTVAEFVANHPYTVALAATGAGFIIKGLTAKIATGKAAAKFAALPVSQLGVKFTLPYPLVRVGGTYAVNTATTKLTGNYLMKKGFTLIAAAYIAKEAGETYPFAKFEISEALQALGIARWKAFEAGDKEAVAALDALQKEILNPKGWEKVIASIPWANVQRAAAKNIQAAVASTEVFNKIIEDEQTARDNGEDDDAKWARIRQEEIDQQKEITDYRLSESKKFEQWKNEAYAEARAAQREEEIKARDEDAAFWAEQQAKQKELEAADRIAIAKFWMAYRKQLQKLREDSRPSQLNFGLL